MKYPRLRTILRSFLFNPLLGLALRFQDKMADLICVRGAVFARKFRRPRAVSSGQIRVCHVTCSFDLGGSQRQIKNFCEQNADLRFRHEAVEIFPEYNFLYRSGVRISAADYSGRSRLAQRLGDLVGDIEFRSLRLVQIYKLYRDFRRLRPDVVVGWGHEMAMLSFAAAAAARVPRIVFSIRTWNPSFGWTPIARLLHQAHRRMVPWTDAVVVNSTPLRRDYAGWLGFPPQWVQVCPNGIDPAPSDAAADGPCRREIRLRLGLPDEAVVVMNIGRFSAEKGQGLLLRAYDLVLAAAPRDDLYLVLGGDGPLLENAKAYAAARGLGRVLFPGRIEDVPAFLWAADIFVMPSDFEGLPNALMEAMARGLACISTDRSGATDVARRDIEALYAAPGDEAALAECILRLADAPAERRRLGSNARSRLGEFSIARMIEGFNGIITGTLKRRP